MIGRDARCRRWTTRISSRTVATASSSTRRRPVKSTYAFEHDLSLAKLVEIGDVPDQQAWADPGMWPPIAFGPTGLIVANASGDVWVGIFVAG